MPMTSQSLSATRTPVSTCPPGGSGTFIRSAAGMSSRVVADEGVEFGNPAGHLVSVGSGELSFGDAVDKPVGDAVAAPVGEGVLAGPAGVPAWRQLSSAAVKATAMATTAPS